MGVSLQYSNIKQTTVGIAHNMVEGPYRTIPASLVDVQPCPLSTHAHLQYARYTYFACFKRRIRDQSAGALRAVVFSIRQGYARLLNTPAYKVSNHPLTTADIPRHTSNLVDVVVGLAARFQSQMGIGLVTLA